MATWNKALHRLTRDDIDAVSTKYLMGWYDLMACGYGFRPKGLNAMRAKYGLPLLTKDWSMEYRIEYIKLHFTDEEIREKIEGYFSTARVGDTRWTGIELFGCRFGREYAAVFRRLLGSSEYRKISEEARVSKLRETQDVLYGGVGLAGGQMMAKARATNAARYGGTNVMASEAARNKVAETNRLRYGGISPFSDNRVREKALRVKNPALWAAMSRYKKTGSCGDILIESRYEFQVFRLLIARFGKDDVFSQYGIHPSDPRYPFNCDFYVKSLDLFIELHLHYSHGGHWFDPDSHDDRLRLKNVRAGGRKRHHDVLMKTWAGSDVAKREKAREGKLHYLVFWGDGRCLPNSAIPDFEAWFYMYDCDYEAFVKDHPENTY